MCWMMDYFDLRFKISILNIAFEVARLFGRVWALITMMTLFL